MPASYVSCRFVLDNRATVLSQKQMVKSYFKFSFQSRGDMNFLNYIEKDLTKDVHPINFGY